ncbi:MAG: glycoside hydrolase family 57 protein [Bacteroidales bacterium]|nr:glycoside hydrolase family 57 protein [Bacteroidales bacterium]
MKTICFYFQVHQPYRLRRYRFFDIAENHDYFDDYLNKSIIRKVAEKCYLPTNKLLLDLINESDGKFRISYSISGTAIDQFEMYAPDVLESFKRLAETGCVEFLSETYSHSLSSLRSLPEFTRQIELHRKKIQQHFNQTPTVFRNTELIYSDNIGNDIANMGFKGMLSEGAKHILGWKSPNFVYNNAINPKLKLLLKNFTLSDDIAFRFSNQAWGEWPLTTEKFVHWLNSIDEGDEIVNLFMDYETFGEHQWEETGIFDFMRNLPKRVFSNSNFEFLTPSQAIEKHQPVAKMHVQYPISWADEERDLTAWLGNNLQDEAFNKLYSLLDKMNFVIDQNLLRDWKYLQTSDHFYYMCTKWFSDGDVHKYFNPYDSPYDAFINYMNVLSDFMMRVDKYLEEQKIDVRNYSSSEISQMIAYYQRKIDEFNSLLKSKNDVKPDLIRQNIPRKTKAKQRQEKYVE